LAWLITCAISRGSCATSWAGVSNVLRHRKKKHWPPTRRLRCWPAEQKAETEARQEKPDAPKALASQVASSRRLAHALAVSEVFSKLDNLAAVSPSPDIRRFSSVLCRCRSAHWLEYNTLSIRTPVMENRPCSFAVADISKNNKLGGKRDLDLGAPTDQGAEFELKSRSRNVQHKPCQPLPSSQRVLDLHQIAGRITRFPPPFGEFLLSVRLRRSSPRSQGKRRVIAATLGALISRSLFWRLLYRWTLYQKRKKTTHAGRWTK